MNISGIKLENFTVFKDVELKFDKGINVFIGENGTGKTHILKVLYSACQSSNPKISFSNKIVRTLYPDDYKISRLITRGIGNRGTNIARIKFYLTAIILQQLLKKIMCVLMILI